MLHPNYWLKFCAITLIMLFSNSVYADDPPPAFTYNDKSEIVQAIYTHNYVTHSDYEDYQKGIIFKLTAKRWRDDPCLTFEIIFPHLPLLAVQKNPPASHLCEFSSEMVRVSNAKLTKKATEKNVYYTFPINNGTMINYYNLQWIGNTPTFIIEYTGGSKGAGTDYYSCGIKTGLGELEGGFTEAVTRPSILCFPLVDIIFESDWNAIPHKSLLETGNAPSY